MAIYLDNINIGSTSSVGADGLTYNNTNGSYGGIRATEGKTDGKWYWEVEIGAYSGNVALGIIKESQSLNESFVTNGSFIGVLSQGLSAPSLANIPLVFQKGDCIGIYLNLDDKEISFYKNGIYSNVKLSVTLNEKVYPAVTSGSSSGAGTGKFNFGGSKFLYLPNDLPFDVKTYNGSKLKPIKKMILKNPSTNQHYSLADKTLIPLPDASNKNMILYGIEAGVEIQLDEAFDKIQYIVETPTVETSSESLVFKKKISKENIPNKISISEVK